MNKTVVELFAGVGGFRVGLNEVTLKNGVTKEKNNFDFVRANQWEPSTKIQYAFNCYESRFGKNDSKNSNIDISLINKKDIPDHALLCGGFPCQDYSVARSLSKEKGIEGKKGVLFWQINEILIAKNPPFVLLENVDRLIKSPSTQRGRDFGIMLRCFFDQNYSVEWRVINAAEYGHAQRRRRIYIFAYKNTTKYAKMQNKFPGEEIINEIGIFAKAFPIEKNYSKINSTSVLNSFKDLVEVSNNFNIDFQNSGFMRDGTIYTVRSIPIFVNPKCLSDIIQKQNVSNLYFLNNDKIKKFEYLRGKKKIERTSASGKKYFYSEGSMPTLDLLSLPGRTMLTSEGTVNRSTHIIEDPSSGNLRILTPIECERLNEFPDNWTNTGMSEKKRYFMMGNALVCGVIKKLGASISKIIEEET